MRSGRQKCALSLESTGDGEGRGKLTSDLVLESLSLLLEVLLADELLFEHRLVLDGPVVARLDVLE